MSLKEEYLQGVGGVTKWFNIFDFMDSCYRGHITPDNSETEYDSEDNTMYLKRKIMNDYEAD